MFMVASSVVLTVVVLNYHHRKADIHEMPSWVSSIAWLEGVIIVLVLDKKRVPAMASLDAGYVAAREENHPENYTHE